MTITERLRDEIYGLFQTQPYPGILAHQLRVKKRHYAPAVFNGALDAACKRAGLNETAKRALKRGIREKR